jgi:L-threonylcarbamoyladenylate synthase
MFVNTTIAIELLNNDEVVALPTETVYGLAAKIDSQIAIEKVFAAKERPLNHPLIVHIANTNDIYRYTIEQPPYLEKLCAAFWPGPLTMILKKADIISPLITAQQDTVAIRMPYHQLTLDIINAIQMPIVAPSANKYCQTSPTCAQHVEDSFASSIAVVDGGRCDIGIESTIIDITANDKITLLRPGMISAEMISEVCTIPCTSKEKYTIKFSGSHKNHYMPKKPLILLDDLEKLKEMPYSYAMLFDDPNDKNHYYQTMPKTPAEYAQQLYQHWHQASSLLVKNIIIEKPPLRKEWLGIHDKLIKAAYKND